MAEGLTRRELMHSAGGIALVAIAPDGRTHFTDSRTGTPSPPQAPPLFQVLPYLQPGPNGSVLRDGDESVVLCWQTNRVPADFTVSFAQKGRSHSAKLTPTRLNRYRLAGDDGRDHFHYVTPLTGLRLNTRYEWRVLIGERRIAEGSFTTRKPRGKASRFVAFGDNSYGDISDRHIAFQAYRLKPDFVVNTGDTVYDNGVASEYTRLFFPVHNADIAHPRVGAPLMRSLLFYQVLGNHDVTGQNAEGIPCADFDRHPDALGYYTVMHLPLNGPTPTYPTPIRGDERQIAVFRTAATGRYPNMANFSFDYGDAHFLCLDANVYVDPTDAALQQWIEQDLKATDAAWKFAVWHHPPFNVGRKHYRNQHMRVLAPLLERMGVSLVFHGHEHVYQRTRPLKFVPGDTSRARAIGTGDRLVPGQFTVDRAFDGEKNTRATGIIYITTGAGGKYLYDPELNNAPDQWLHPEDANADYNARFISDRHSLTVVDMDSQSLSVRQVDEWGNEVDRFRITR